MDVRLLCIVQVAASATSWSLVQSPTVRVCVCVCLCVWPRHLNNEAAYERDGAISPLNACCCQNITQDVRSSAPSFTTNAYLHEGWYGAYRLLDTSYDIYRLTCCFAISLTTLNQYIVAYPFNELAHILRSPVQSMVDGSTATHIFNFSTLWKRAVRNTPRFIKPGGTVHEPIEP
jgi:hypothetical protein